MRNWVVALAVAVLPYGCGATRTITSQPSGATIRSGPNRDSLTPTGLTTPVVLRAQSESWPFYCFQAEMPGYEASPVACVGSGSEDQEVSFVLKTPDPPSSDKPPIDLSWDKPSTTVHKPGAESPAKAPAVKKEMSWSAESKRAAASFTVSLEALEEVATATSVGVNMAEYNRRLIDTKIRVEKSLAEAAAGNVPSDAIRAARMAMDAYEAASSPLNWKIQNFKEHSRTYENGYYYFTTDTLVMAWINKCPAAVVQQGGSLLSGIWIPDTVVRCYWDDGRRALAEAKNLAPSAPPPPQHPTDADVPVEDRLRKLKSLRTQKLITEEEYVSKRRAILDGL